MLRGYNDGTNTQRLVVVAVLYGYLALGVGAQVGHLLALLANLRQCLHNEMRKVERSGHVIVGLVAGIAEHHTLVAGSLLVFFLA